MQYVRTPSYVLVWLVAGSRYASMEPFLALVAAAVFVLLCLGWRGPQRQSRSRRFWIGYITLGAGSLLVAVALWHDWAYPSQVFRAATVLLALTAGVIALPLLLVLVLRETNVLVTWQTKCSEASMAER